MYVIYLGIRILLYNLASTVWYLTTYTYSLWLKWSEYTLASEAAFNKCCIISKLYSFFAASNSVLIPSLKSVFLIIPSDLGFLKSTCFYASCNLADGDIDPNPNVETVESYSIHKNAQLSFETSLKPSISLEIC